MVVVIAKWMAQLTNATAQPPVGTLWGDTSVSYVVNAGESLHDIFTGATIEARDSLRVAELFGVAPFCVLTK